MEKMDIAKDIITYVVRKANVSLNESGNNECGFLTGHRINSLSEEELRTFSVNLQTILMQYAKAMAPHASSFDDHDWGMMFQYVFNRSFEISYKIIIGKEVDTLFNVTEAFDYYELDVPEYIQLKVTNVVNKIALVFLDSWNYIKDKEYKKDDVSTWLFPLLLGASTIAMNFALEMDMDDDTEMQHYLQNEE